MTQMADPLAIGSRYGVLRDWLPIYSLRQLALNLVAITFIWWIVWDSAGLSAVALCGLMFAWLVQYQTRPSVMQLLPVQADWLIEILEEQAFYAKAENDGRWRESGKPWWQRLPHQFIAFERRGDQITVVAPRDIMEMMRASLECADEQGEVYFTGNGLFEMMPPENLTTQPWHVKMPAVAIGSLCVAVNIWHVATDDTVTNWGLSSHALSQGRFETIALHMFAHGGAMHLIMNMSALAVLGSALTARLGPVPLSWLRFLILYFLGGLSGAAAFLTLHPTGSVPMIGASGAIFALLGLLTRLAPDGHGLLSVRSTKVRRIGWSLVKQNAFLFGLLALLASSTGGNGGLAWEAHLGGFLFGLFVGPYLLPRDQGTATANPSDIRTAGVPV